MDKGGLMLISPAYRDLNRQLHDERSDYGSRGANWAKTVSRLVDEECHTSVLDYGCGKGALAASLPHIISAEYDPAIPGKDAAPEPADLVVCTDVLEHIEPKHLNAVLRDLRRVTKRKLFAHIATRPAAKTLADGRNAHLLVKPPQWWRLRLEKLFHIIVLEVFPGAVTIEAVPRLDECPRAAFKRPTKRRPVPRELAGFFDHVRQQASRYNDAFSRIETIKVWEGIGDEPADMQCVANLLEHWPDPDEALLEICSYASKAVMLAITLGDGRSAADWRKILAQRLRLAEFHEIGNQIMALGSPTVAVQGVTATGAVSADDRWAQVAEAVKRVPKRIETAPAHGRRAILACYGPSLESTLPLLVRERAETGAAVVSVSGAHDFLLSHGIVPDYHVECDPRPHKADNIDKMHPSVTYLLASCVHPVLFDKLGQDADVRLWHVSTAEHAIRLIDELGEKPEHVISGGGSVGLRSIPLLYALGYRDISVYAMDCSFADDGGKQWAGRHFGKRQDVVMAQCDERIFYTSPTLLSYATNFWETVQKVPDLDVRLFGDGFLQAMARYYMGFAQNEAA